MIEARVRVVATAEGMAWVGASEQSGCAACQAQSGCAIAGLGKYLSRRRPILPIARRDARVGDELLVCVDESELLRAGLFAYLLPALLAVIGAALADTAGAGDLAAALASLFGFTAGLLGARFLAPAPCIESQAITPHPLTPWRES